MKVAISAQGGDLEALVDLRFGRAPWLIIADTESGEYEAVDNRANAEAARGAGVQAATTVASRGVGAVITGNVGPNAHKVLVAAGIVAHTVESGVSVREALASLKRGDLPTAEEPTVGAHGP